MTYVETPMTVESKAKLMLCPGITLYFVGLITFGFGNCIGMMIGFAGWFVIFLALHYWDENGDKDDLRE